MYTQQLYITTQFVSIIKKVCPKRIFCIEDILLLFGQIMRVVGKKVKYHLSVERKKMLSYMVGIIYPQHFI